MDGLAITLGRFCRGWRGVVIAKLWRGSLNQRRGRPRTAIRRCLGGMLLSLGAALSANAATPEELAGPDVTIIAGEERTIYEYRQNGVLRMVKIVPNWGKPYYLYPRDQTTGFGDLQAADMLLPTWVIVEF